MNEPNVLLVSFGVATAFFLGLVLLFTLALDWGFIGICWATTINYILRFVISYAYITFKPTFTEANKATIFQRKTIQNLGY